MPKPSPYPQTKLNLKTKSWSSDFLFLKSWGLSKMSCQHWFATEIDSLILKQTKIRFQNRLHMTLAETCRLYNLSPSDCLSSPRSSVSASGDMEGKNTHIHNLGAASGCICPCWDLCSVTHACVYMHMLIQTHTLHQTVHPQQGDIRMSKKLESIIAEGTDFFFFFFFPLPSSVHHKKPEH